MHKTIIILSAFATLLSAQPTAAQQTAAQQIAAMDFTPDGISVAYGRDLNRGVVMSQKRLGLRWQWHHNLFTLPGWQSTAYIDASASFLNSQARSEKIKINHLPSAAKTRVFALAPVFRFEPQGYQSVQPYIDLGLGAAWIDDHNLEREGTTRQRLGGHGQFEVRAGAGLRFGPQRSLELGYQWIHYSNATLHNMNMGLDFHMVNLGFWFP